MSPENGAVTIANNVFNNNSSLAGGGAIYENGQYSGDTQIYVNSFDGNSAPFGIDIYLVSTHGASATIFANTFSDIQRFAIYTDGIVVTITDDNIFPNPPPTPIETIINNEITNPSSTDTNVVNAVTSEITHIIYVNQNATGGGDNGTSWSNAFLTLQEGLAAAAATPGEDQIWVAQGTYSPPSGSTYVIPNGVAIFGGFAGTETSLAARPLNGTTTLDGGSGISNIMSITGGVDAILDGFVFTNPTGSSSAGITASLADLLIFNSTFSSLQSMNNGSAINDFVSSLTIRSSIFQQNTSTISGGAINAQNSTVNIGYSTFTGNTSSGSLGGAINLYDNYDSTSLIFNSSFSGNSAVGGGAIEVAGQSGAFAPGITIQNSSFSGNSANYGGALRFENVASMTLSNDQFTSNTETGGGGGAISSFNNGSVLIDQSTFTDNSGPSDGGAIASVQDGTFTVQNSTFSGNSSNHGGAVWTQYDNTIFSNDYFISNSDTGGNGGAIGSLYNQSVLINQSTFTDNYGTGGGAITTDTDNSIIIKNSNFSGNNVQGYGGAIKEIEGQSSLTITNSTFNGDSASLGGGGIYAIGFVNTDTGDSDVEFLHINNTSFTNETTQGNGGAIEVSYNELSISGGTFSGDQAVNGGAIYENNNYLMSIEGATFTGNSASNNGGAIDALNNTVVINVYGGVSGNAFLYTIDTIVTPVSILNDTFTYNYSGVYGGAVYSQNNVLTLSGNSFGLVNQGNWSWIGGAVASFDDQSVTVTDNSFTDNTGYFVGGAMLIQGTSSAVLSQNTFTGNTGGSWGGAIFFLDNTFISSYQDTFSDNSNSVGGSGGGGAIYADGNSIILNE